MEEVDNNIINNNGDDININSNDNDIISNNDNNNNNDPLIETPQLYNNDIQEIDTSSLSNNNDNNTANDNNYQEGELTKDIICNSFHSLGRHPLSYSNTYLGVNLSNKQLININMIQQYPKLMYVDISSNSIQSLDILSNLPMLVQLNASSNEIDECLTFNPPYCNDDNRWSTGHDACGSMLTLANLNSNKITKIKDLSNHSFLECLLLSKNMIRSITGLEKLQYLQVLDISYNQITKIEGLNNLNIQELNLEGNYIETLEGLSTLNRLTSLNVASNMITCIAPLSASNSLRNLNLKNNKVFTIRQIEFLSELPWLQYLEMHGNPCCCKQNFRARVIFRLSKLLKLDRTIVSAEEKVRSYNLYETDLGDLRGRTEIFQKYLPNQEFKLYTPTFFDDEMELSINDLLNEYDKEYDEAKKQNKIEIVSNVSKAMYSDLMSQALSRTSSPEPM